MDIVKPEPLRIIKRVTSKGSPTSGFDGPLTIRKKRQGRSSIMTESLNDNEMDLASEGALQDLIRQQISERNDVEYDPDVTPKAVRGMARTISAGAFLRSELHQRSSEIDATRYSVRGDRSNFHSHDQYENLRPIRPKKGSPVIPERRPSKSKNFFLRALAGQTHNTLRKEHPKSIRLVDSKASKDTLIRRLSRGRNSQSSSDEINSNPSRVVSSSGNSHFDKSESSDSVKIGENSKLSSSYGGGTQVSLSRSSSVASRLDSQIDVYVLSPQIIITPEVCSVDTKDSYLWVAIEISGQLRRADGDFNPRETERAHLQSANSEILDLRHYGRLHSMKITFDLGPPCVLSDFVGDLNNTRTLRAGETHLFLIKAHFSTSSPRRHVREASSHDLMTELQHDLGETRVKYITVRMNYKHSAFDFRKDAWQETEGTVSHTTRCFTEASAVIRRHNSRSAWSPRTSQTINQPLINNPLIPLIERLLPLEEAKEVIRKISAERPSLARPKRFTATESSEETIKPDSRMARTNSAVHISLISSATIVEPSAPISPEGQDEIDPARRIWTEMRRHSRGHGHQRKSISADHYFSLDDEPSRSSSSDSARTDPEIDRERGKIMEVALRNKRSVGQETLRSMAPSIDHKVKLMEPKTGTMNGLGLGTGNRWWGHPWW